MNELPYTCPIIHFICVKLMMTVCQRDLATVLVVFGNSGIVLDCIIMTCFSYSVILMRINEGQKGGKKKYCRMLSMMRFLLKAIWDNRRFFKLG